MAKEQRLQTPKGRLSFSYLFEPRTDDRNPQKAPRYSVSLIFDKAAQETAEFKALQAAVRDAVTAEFGIDQKQPDGTTKRVIPKGVKNPLRDGAEKVDSEGKPYDGYGEGTKFLSASTERPPGIVGGDNKIVTDPKSVYDGCYVRASVVVFTYDTNGNKGASFGLRNVQKMADGEPFRGSDPTKDFGVVEGYSSSGASADFSAASGPTADEGSIPF